MSSLQRIFGDIVGMDDRAVQAISLSKVLSDYPAWNKEQNPNILPLMKDVFVSEGVPTRNYNKGALFATFMTYYCRPSMARDMPSRFTDDAWFEFLGEHKLRKQRNRQRNGVGVGFVALLLLVAMAAAVVLPIFFIHLRTMRNTRVALDAMCMTNEGMELKVDCNDAACSCCYDMDTGDLCE